jgi:hypothetical protein
MLLKRSPVQVRSRKSRLGIASLGLAALLGFTGAVGLSGAQVEATTVSSVKTAVAFNCNESEATIRGRGGPSVTIGSTSFYIGYQQVSSINKNPRLIRFDSGRRVWCRTDYEVTGDDGTGYGLIWNGGSTLYGVFSSTGTQGTASQDFRRYATRGWLTSYGQGGGRKVAILARIDPATGNVNAATFLSALLTSGSSNSIQVTSLAFNNTNLVVNAASWFSPRRRDRTRMNCTGTAPFPYTIEFLPGLNSATRASARGCS